MKHVSVKCAEGYRGSAGVTILANSLVQLWIRHDEAGNAPKQVVSYEFSHDELAHLIHVLTNAKTIADSAGISSQVEDDEE